MELGLQKANIEQSVAPDMPTFDAETPEEEDADANSGDEDKSNCLRADIFMLC